MSKIVDIIAWSNKNYRYVGYVSMYSMKVEKSLRLLKYETIAWLVIRVVHDESILV